MRAYALCIALVALAVAVQASGEVESLEATPSAGVLGLTARIKDLQSDIKTIREKKAHHEAKHEEHATSAGLLAGARVEEYERKAITHKARAADLAHQEAEKTKAITDTTISQHGSAGGGVSGSVSGSAGGISGSLSFSAGGYGGSGSFKVGPSRASELFDSWHGKWEAMRATLSKEVNTQHQAVNHQMEIVRKAYEKEYAGHVSAVHRAKELQSKIPPHIKAEKTAKAEEQKVKKKMQEALHKARELQAKAVEKKQKQIDAQEKRTKALEVKVKSFHQNDCGPAKEQEQKAKAEIKRLQAVNHKIRTDCEVKAKEVTTKHHEQISKSHEKTAKEKARADALALQLQAAKQRILHLQHQLHTAQQTIAHLQQQLAHQKQLTSEQRSLKEAALQKVKDLTAQLAAMTAKYNKLKSNMDHINNVSGQPAKK